MVRRWILYLVILLGSIGFYIANQLWLGWFLLVTVLVVPLFSLVVSLPAMVSTRAGVQCPGLLEKGMVEIPILQTHCPMPMPPVRGRIRVSRTTTGQTWLLKDGEKLPTDHCGQLVCRGERVYIYDYLGLFRMKISRRKPASAIVRPDKLHREAPPELDRHLSRAWKPKPGGGFSENHEMRLYRPGDNLNQVHWKLSAKTGKLVVREALEPQLGRVLVTMNLRGDADVLDQKFSELLWIGGHLVGLGLRFELLALTGGGFCSWVVTNETELEKALDQLLSQPPASGEGSALDRQLPATWRYHIGGESGEA